MAATQLRFDTARLFTAQERTSTTLFSCLFRRTRADLPVSRPPHVQFQFLFAFMAARSMMILTAELRFFRTHVNQK